MYVSHLLFKIRTTVPYSFLTLFFVVQIYPFIYNSDLNRTMNAVLLSVYTYVSIQNFEASLIFCQWY